MSTTRRRAVEFARLREKPIAAISKDLQISESCLRRWMDQADVEDGHKQGLSTDERKELAELQRKNRVLEMEVEILKRASACFAGENVLQNPPSAEPDTSVRPSCVGHETGRTLTRPLAFKSVTTGELARNGWTNQRASQAAR